MADLHERETRKNASSTFRSLLVLILAAVCVAALWAALVISVHYLWLLTVYAWRMPA